MGQPANPAKVLFLREGKVTPESGLASKDVFDSLVLQKQESRHADEISKVSFSPDSNLAIWLTVEAQATNSLFPANNNEPYILQINFNSTQKSYEFKRRIESENLLFTIYSPRVRISRIDRYLRLAASQGAGRYLPLKSDGLAKVYNDISKVSRFAFIYAFNGEDFKNFSLLNTSDPLAELEIFHLWPRPDESSQCDDLIKAAGSFAPRS